MSWTLADALEQARGADVAALVGGYERGLAPLTSAEPKGMSARDPSKRGALSRGLGDDLALIATKIAPTIATEQADAWIKVMVTALSDLPGRVAREAAQAALHRPMRFLNEVETVIREHANLINARHRLALGRLRDLLREIENPQPKLADPAVSHPMTSAEIRALSRPFREMALGQGWLTQGEIDAADAEPAA